MTWRIATLDDLKSEEPRAITDGPFGSNLASRHYTDDGPRVVRLQNIGDGRFGDARAHVSQEHFESLRAHEVRPGDLLVASLGEVLPRACLAPTWLGPAIVKADCIRVRLGDRVDPRWVLYALQRPEVRRWADEHRHGVGRPRLGLKTIREIPIPLPPLDEQRRIVDLLEDHLSRLDAAEQWTAAAGRRVGALQWASIARAVSDTTGSEVILGDIAGIKNGIFVSRPGPMPNGVPILRIGAVRPLDLDLTDLRYSQRSVADLEAADSLLQADDLLFTRYNGNPRYVGACAVVPASALPLTYPDKLIRVRVDPVRALPGYVSLACSVGSARAQIQAAVKTTSGQAGISGRDLKAVRIRVPLPRSQQEVLSRVADLRSATMRLGIELRSTAQRGRTLRRSLLTAAFSGQLTGRVDAIARLEEVVG